MRPEYGMRRQTVDEEMGRNDKLFFMVDEGQKKKRDFICPSTTSSSPLPIGAC